MIPEIKEILEDGNVKTVGDFKPIFLGFANITYKYCGYIRKSVYLKASAVGELGYYKDKTHTWEGFMRSHVGLFIEMCDNDSSKSIQNNSNLDMLLTQAGTVWQNVTMLSEEANHRLDLNLLSFMNYYRDSNRSDKLNNLLES